MDSFIPKHVKDLNEFRHEWNKCMDWLKRNTLRSSEDIKVTQNSNGVTLEVSNRIKQKIGSQQTPVGVNVGAVWL